MKIKDIQDLLNDFEDEPTGDHFLDSRYDPNSKYYRFFYQLTKRFKPKTLVELGSWQGTSAAYFAGGWKETKVITVDHHTDPGDQENKQLTQRAENYFNNLVYCQGWTCDAIFKEEEYNHSRKGENAYPKVLKALNEQTIDVLFIDSWHVYHQAKRDWEAYSPLLSKNALIIVDDCIQGTPGSAIDGVRQFFDELPGDKMLIDSLHKGYPMGVVIHDI